MVNHRRFKEPSPTYRELPDTGEQLKVWHEMREVVSDQGDLREALMVVTSLSLSPDIVGQIEELDGSDVDDSERDRLMLEVLRAYSANRDNQQSDAVVERLKALNEQAALFGYSDSPFSLKDDTDQLNEELEYPNRLARELYQEAVRQKSTRDEETIFLRKRAGLLRALQILHGKDKVYASQQEAGYYLGAAPPHQLRYFPEHMRKERGIYTQQMIRGEAMTLSSDRFLLNEQEVERKFNIEDKGSLIAIVRAGDPSSGGSNIEFGVFSKPNEEGDQEFSLHYIPSNLEKDKIRDGHRYSEVEDDITSSEVVDSGVKFGPSGVRSGYLGVASRRNVPVLDGLIGEVNETLRERGVKQGFLYPPDETLAPFHLNISFERGRLILHDVRSETLGVTVVQSALFGEHDKRQPEHRSPSVADYAIQGAIG